VVIAHDKEGLVARVKCNTCGSEHKYYSDKRRAAIKQKKEKAAKVAKNKREAEYYARLMENSGHKKVVSYDMSETYDTDDIIDHKTFGKGIVINAYFQKMDVLFESGLRILACNR